MGLFNPLKLYFGYMSQDNKLVLLSIDRVTGDIQLEVSAVKFFLRT